MGLWPVTPPASNELNPGGAALGAIALDSWLPPALAKDYCFVFLPSGSVQTNDLTSFDDAYHVIVAGGVEYSAASPPPGPSTVTTNAPGYFTPTSLGDPFTVTIEKTGTVSVMKGAKQSSGGIGIGEGFSPSIAPAPRAPVPVVANRNPILDEIVVSPKPIDPAPGIDATVGPQEHLTLVVEAADPDGDELFCQWSCDKGHFSSPGETRMQWDEAKRVRRSVWTWQPPHDAATGDPFRLECTVRDESGAIASPIVGSVVNGETEPPSKLFYIREGEGAMFTSHSDGSGQRRVTVDSPGMASLCLSTDTSRLCYTTTNKVFISNLDGSVKSLVYTSPVRCQDAQLNPEGTRIAFANWVGGPASEIWIVNVDGTNPHAVASDPGWDHDSPEFDSRSRVWAQSSLSRPHKLMFSMRHCRQIKVYL